MIEKCNIYINNIDIMISNLKKKHVQYGQVSLKNWKCTWFIGCNLIFPYYFIITNYPNGTFITAHKEINSFKIERIFHFAQSKFGWIGLLPIYIWNVHFFLVRMILKHMSNLSNICVILFFCLG